MLLRRVNYQNSRQDNRYPFHFEWLKDLNKFSFNKPVTILVGENGSGKTTLLEALGIQANAILLSNESLEESNEYEVIKQLAYQLQLIWNYRTQTGFFFRADDFISYIRATTQRKREAEEALAEIEDPHSLARMPHARTLYELNNLYSKDLTTLSHGQAFLELFQARLRTNGLYLLDEPESPLTPQNQLALIRMIKDAEKEGSQFIISTHSPIVMAYPNAEIIEISENGLKPIHFNEIEHVSFMKNFLESPEHYIHYLMKDD